MAQRSLKDSLNPILEFEERDQAGNIVATYIVSPASDAKNGRVDVIIPRASQSFPKVLLNAFLPAGYPASVTKDYLRYQIFDSLQAFSSSIAGLLSSRAVLEGVGVGDANASPTAALLLSVLQDSMGRIATILFAHKLGTSLEPECKMYRLAADVFNDSAMILDCLSPAFPKAWRVMLLSFSSVLRALCGVAAGSSKASLSAHFATQGNLGELNAKDSSQETVISLLGMLAGAVLVSHITTPFATWASLLVLLSIHISMNYLAVRAVSMRTLNRQRANIVFTTYLARYDVASEIKQHQVLTPEQVSPRERIFELDGVLRWHDGTIFSSCSLGVPFSSVLDSIMPIHKSTGSYEMDDTLANKDLDSLLNIFAIEQYILFYSRVWRRWVIVLKKTAATETQLKGWMHALVCARRFHAEKIQGDDIKTILKLLRDTLRHINELWVDLGAALLTAGWDLDRGAMETKSGTRMDTVKGR